MSLLEDRTASFIVRIWQEGGEGSHGGTWRGSIEHAPSGRRVFFCELEAIVTFMTPYIRQLGIDPQSRRRSQDEPSAD